MSKDNKHRAHNAEIVKNGYVFIAQKNRKVVSMAGWLGLRLIS